MVDIIDISLAINQADKILNDLNDVFTREHTHVHRGLKRQLLVDAETTHFTQVIAFLAEEEVVDYLAGSSIIGWLGVAQLAIDVVDGLSLTVTGVLAQRVIDNLIFADVDILLVQQNGLHARLQDGIDVLGIDDSVALNDHLITLNRDDLTSTLVDKVLIPRVQHTGSHAASDALLEIGLVHFDFFSQTKDLDDVVVGLHADGTQQRGHGQFLLAIDVGIHHVINIGGKLNP